MVLIRATGQVVSERKSINQFTLQVNLFAAYCNRHLVLVEWQRDYHYIGGGEEQYRRVLLQLHHSNARSLHGGRGDGQTRVPGHVERHSGTE